ncbi:MAG: D-sedoheptulose 7-phosphate isomerase [Chlamydiales bacterium]|jgi:D-sedoheptulose 7-phosphate isomerase
MKDIRDAVEDGIRAIEQLRLPSSIAFIENVATAIAESFDQGNKVIIAGNGGSLCDAMHFAEELTGQFRGFRPALPAIALSCPGHITCAANDFGFENVFSRGIEAYGKAGDVFVGLTTSGNSPNIIKAFEAASEREMTTVSFLGKGGGELKGVADLELCIEGFSTSDRIQEAHMTAIHILIEMVEKKLFSFKPAFSEA